MTNNRQVYLLNPQELSPETIAVTFAKTSRSPKSFREIASELNDEKSAEFNEKWVVGYGHSSVAEHAVLHIAVENISRLAVEALESNRLASYTEKSSRYQKWSPENFFIPGELDNSELKQLYIQTCKQLFEDYQQSIPAVQSVVEKENPRQPGESEASWERRIRTDITDVCRFFLPASSLANVGVTINARTLEHALQKMLSSPLQEIQALGNEIKKTALAEVPTLIKYADRVPYLMETRKSIEEVIQQIEWQKKYPEDWCHLAAFDPDGERRILAAALYRFGGMDFGQAYAFIEKCSTNACHDLANRLLGMMTSHDIPLRELEHSGYTFDIILDQGAFFELKRHRMMTLTPQSLTTDLGYAVPKKIVQSGFENIYRNSMEKAREAYQKIYSFNPDVASYVVPNAFNRRVLITTNLRSAKHLIGLRTAPNAHFSIRRISRRMAELIRESSPVLGQYLIPELGETWQEIERDYFSQV
jgi:thymidylate synthase ThyX